MTYDPETLFAECKISRRRLLGGAAALGAGAALGVEFSPMVAYAAGVDTAVIAIPTLAGNFEPTVWHGFGDSVHVMDCIARGLVHIDFHTNDPLPAVAKSWKVSADGLTYEFIIQDGLTFHDDTPITAQAVQRSFNRMIDKTDVSYQTGNTAIDNLGGGNIVGFEAPDPKTFRIKLKAPDAALLARLTRPDMIIISSAALDKFGANIGPNMVSCGPYKLSKVTANESAELDAFPNFYAGAPKIKHLSMQVLPDPLALTAALTSGHVNLTNMIPHSNIARLTSDKQVNVIVPKAFISLFMAMNAKAGILTDLRVRQAINLAIDRNAIIREGFFGKGELPAYLSPRSMGAFDPAQMVFSTQDMPKAKSLLAAAGAQGGSVHILSDNGLFWPRVGQVVQQNLTDLGLKPVVEYVDDGTFNGRMFDPKQHEMGLWQRSAFMPDLDDKFSPLFASDSFVAKNATCHTDLPTQAKLDALLKAGVQEQDTAKRMTIYKQVNALLAQDVMVYAMLADIYLPVISTSNITGVDADAFGTYRTFPETLAPAA